MRWPLRPKCSRAGHRLRLAALLLAFAGMACGGGTRGQGPDAATDVPAEVVQDALPDALPDTPGPDAGPYRFTGPGWYRDAVLYQVWVRSYADSDGDGIGDLKGILARLDPIAALGVGAIWLSPFHPTPYKDSGYDVADYYGVDPAYGTLADWDALVAAAHARGIRVMDDIVLNHTSSEHEWFKASRSSREDPKRDWYVWSDDPPPFACPNSDTKNFGSERWTLDPVTGQRYYHMFKVDQPDLNYDNPDVASAIQDVVRFWLDRGVDGYRVDAIGSLIEEPASPATGGVEVCDASPRTHAYLKGLRTVVDGYPDRVMLAEAWQPEFFGNGRDEFQMAFSNDAQVGLLGAAMTDNPAGVFDMMPGMFAAMPAEAQVACWLSNHDMGRISAQLENDPGREAVAAVMLLTVPCTPIVYYGDEVGMAHGTGVVVDGRDRARTPMAWNAGPGVGFTTGTPWLAPSPDPQGTSNVAAQDGVAGSLLTLYRDLIALRNRVGSLGGREWAAVPVVAGDGPYAYVRGPEGARVLVVLNAGDAPASATLDASAFVTRPADCAVAKGTAGALDPVGAAAWPVDLPARGYLVCEL